MMSGILATLSVLEIEVLYTKVYDFTASVHVVTNKISSGNSNYVVDVVL